MQHTPDANAVQTLDRELREIFGSRLQSLVRYGPDRAPTHTMATIDKLTRDDLRACAARIEGWHDAGLATPLLVAAHEFDRSLPVFPLEFGAILANHVVVSGSSPFAGMRVEAADIRRACEIQARSHLLHLRQGFLETRGRSDALSVLIVRSAAAFALLLTSVARLEGRNGDDAAASARHVERLLAVPGAAAEIVTLAHVHEISSAEAERLFPPYLDAVERLVNYVDGWSAR
jgi:hypothetical protein